MAQQSWPYAAYNTGAVTDEEYEALAARFSDDGVYGIPSDTQVVAAGTGLSVDVRADVRASVRGHGWYSGTTTVNLPISANASGSTRVDWVVLRLDRSTWTVAATTREGTPGAGVPALVQDEDDYSTGVYEIPLAQVTVLTGASAVSVTRAELYVGTRLRPCTSSIRNPMPRTGEINYEVDTGRLILWNGSTWRTVADDSGGVVTVNSKLSAWDFTVDSVLEKRNGSVHLRLGSFQRKAGTLSGTAESRLPVLIPAAYRHASRDQYAICYTTGLQVSRAIIYNRGSNLAGQVWLTNHPAISTGDFVLPASGISWVVD
ncbi:hypothetical protein [Streptomyces sediminimaris]|uniref:hypothetical protein n=1 Tax=Streptomyces sediminimaris TaxID=3383721 RepID=UPI00399B58B5